MRIRTAYLGATETLPSRVRAKSDEGSLIIENFDGTSQTPHKDVAEKLAGIPLVPVATTMSGYVFVSAEDSDS